MVYVVLTDRLGNNLFQIAAAASLANKYNTDYRVCISDFKLPNGKNLEDSIAYYKENILRNVTFVSEIPSDAIEYLQDGFHYSPLPYFDNICLKGYFQSEKFFDKTLVRNMFAIDENTKIYIQNKYAEILKNEIISLHVRRGDYVYRPRRQRLCSLSYYRHAINYFGRNKKFLVLSDDIEWCKNHFRGDNFIYPDRENALIDLYLQSLCTHNIISNSTFSWWGAWLNNNENKVVIAPKQWFGKHSSGYKMDDMIPSSWIRLNNPKSFRIILRAFWYDILDYCDRIRGIQKFRG